MISCILLSAGLSQRFGSPKALVQLPDGQLVIEHLQQNLLDSNIDEIIIVLGAYVNEIKPRIFKHNKVTFVYNKDFLLGQTSSFKVGLQNVSTKSQAVMLLPVDFSLVQTETFNILIEQFNHHPQKIVIPSYSGKNGHPPIFPIYLSPEFLALENNFGLNTVIHNHSRELKIFPVVDSGVVKTFNTKEEFGKLFI